MDWTIDEAQRGLDALLRAAEDEPQVVTKDGTAVAVIIGIDLYREMVGAGTGLAEHLLAAPVGDDLEIVRDTSPLREVLLDA
ncbi:type II toxin-antitoxin system Phd/YefM family antitoxin [Cellulosimicrobium sp. SH8]|uniref:type II toxin-antitoxin system Phd/YefM family antitoxin n=1 Tax=Cellulosimicrobium sp. SH8 TaxID=2952936 RepID=UPI0021F2D8F1|nr:type II toxin-antitoxin system Phd/YefM family antitoxin [Cellulosimicrobium sp. SH8]